MRRAPTLSADERRRRSDRLKGLHDSGHINPGPKPLPAMTHEQMLLYRRLRFGGVTRDEALAEVMKG